MAMGTGRPIEGYYPYVPQIPHEIVLRKYGVRTIIKL